MRPRHRGKGTEAGDGSTEAVNERTEASDERTEVVNERTKAGCEGTEAGDRRGTRTSVGRDRFSRIQGVVTVD